MNSLLRLYSNMLILATTALTVTLDPNHAKPDNTQDNLNNSEDPRTFNEALQTCFSKRNHGTLECLNRGALTVIQSWNDDQCLDFGEIQLQKVEGEGRTNLFDLEWDPKDFSNVLRATSRMLERRNVRWDLSYLYPGLQMRVGPTLSAENGVLEFVMDERASHYHNRQLGSGNYHCF